MHQVPSELKYLATHEWLRIEGNIGIIGITDHAQDALGDVVFVDLPEVNREIKAGEEVAVIESVKAASDIYTPVSGKIIKINTQLADDPGIVNQAPYAEGWLFQVQLSHPQDAEKLLTHEQYSAMTV
jgi:glycine cleavage system H protein